MQHKCNTIDASVIQVRQECYTNDTSVTQILHKQKILILITTLVKTYFHTLILTIYKVKDYKKNEQFHSENYLLEMSRFHAKMCLKSAPQKLNFLMAKAISKRCALDCGCKCP